MINELSPLDIKSLLEQRPNRYYIRTIDLSTANNNLPIEFEGDFFQVLSISSGAVITVRLNEQTFDAITFGSESHYYGLYKRIFITNTAQTGKSVQLFLGNGVYYSPFYRVQSILPNISVIISGVTSITPTGVLFPSAITAFDTTIYNLVRLVVFNNETGDQIKYGQPSAVTFANGMMLAEMTGMSFDFLPFYLATDLKFVADTGKSLSMSYLLYGTPK